MLKPDEIRYRKITEGTSWYARGYRVMAVFREHGKRRRKLFVSQKEATAWGDDWIAEIRAGGATHPISPEERAAILSTRPRLVKIGASITDALSEGLDVLAAKANSETVAELVQLRLDAMRTTGLSARHQQITKTRLGHFALAFGAWPVPLVRATELDKWLLDLRMHPRTVRHYRATLHALFAEAVRRQMIVANPVDRTLAPKVPESEIGILTPAQARIVLDTADSIGCLGRVAIGLFAGLRQSEILALRPEDVDPVRGFVRVTAGKTRASRRIVTMDDALRAWLPEDPLAKRQQHYHALLVDALPFPWPGNCLRHSYATYHLAKHRDVVRLSAEMGNSPAIVRRHYAELVGPQEAETFWALRPAKPANVVRMAG